MFVNGADNITSRLGNIHLSVQSNMQPKAERPPMCPKGQLPQLHLTPSGGQKRDTGSSQLACGNPCLLKPQHDIPPTPPPQTKSQPPEFFPQRIG